MILLLCLLAAPNGELAAQGERVLYGVVVTNAFSARNPVQGTGDTAREIGEVFERLRPGSVEFQVAFPFFTRPRLRLEYSPGLMPLVWVRDSLVEELRQPDSRRTSLGIGISPLNLRAIVGSERLAVEASVAGAVLWYRHPTPTATATKTNFLGSASVGLRVQLDEFHVVGGYRRSHISNAGRAEFNPGIDSSDVYIGLWFR